MVTKEELLEDDKRGVGKSGIPPSSGLGKRQFKSDYPDSLRKRYLDGLLVSKHEPTGVVAQD